MSLRVLVAEDETIIRLDIVSLLRSAGFEVCAEARDGAEAVELARITEPDIALLDVKMPNLDGIEAARRIRAARPIPIVMLTAFTDPALVARAIDAGIGGYLVKPFKGSDLVPALRIASARNAELLAAEDGGPEQRPRPIDLRVHGRTGESWPLRLPSIPDGPIRSSGWTRRRADD